MTSVTCHPCRKRLENSENSKTCTDELSQHLGQHRQESFPERNDGEWMKHTLAWFDGGAEGAGLGARGDVRIDYRPVHDYTLTDEVDYIKSKARVY